jgi:hypothetical protein
MNSTVTTISARSVARRPGSACRHSMVRPHTTRIAIGRPKNDASSVGLGASQALSSPAQPASDRLE